MTDWTGSGSTIATPTTVADCVQYLTVAQVRAEYGDEVSADTDEKIQRRIDQMAAYAEDQLGHTFGRALIVSSTAASLCTVTASELTLGGTSYTFADYPTLYELAAAVNDDGAAYQVERLPHVRSDTPSTLLKARAASACGPNYADRVVLCLSAMYHVGSGRCRTRHFLPLNVAEIVSITENALALTESDYYWGPGESWLIKKACGCLITCCGHPPGYWSGAAPHNIAVTFVPEHWGHVPAVVSSLLLQAYEARGGLAPYSSEQFGDYSYRRKTAPAETWQNVLGSGALRPYAVKFMP